MEIIGSKRPDLITDSIAFAKELAFELEIRDPLPTYSKIHHTLDIMNNQLKSTPIEHRSLIGAESVFLVPFDTETFDRMNDPEILDTKDENAVLKAKINSICWVGSAPVAGFGLMVFGVDFIEPVRKHTATAFIPLDYLNVHLAA